MIKRLNNTLLNNKWLTEEIKREIKANLEINDNKTRWCKTYGMDAAKVVLRGKFIAIQFYFKKQDNQVDIQMAIK